jgi:hypothetical protein
MVPVESLKVVVVNVNDDRPEPDTELNNVAVDPNQAVVCTVLSLNKILFSLASSPVLGL